MSQATGKNRASTPDNQFLLRETVSKNGSTPRVARKGADFHEKQPLFDRPPAEPVKLTPAWEETNLPNDELNFKGVTMEQADLEINPPIDRYKLVYLTLLLHGIGTLLPWNMFINANSYFVEFKLKPPGNSNDDYYQSNFMYFLTFGAQIPNVVFNWLNVFVRIGGNLTTRIVWSIMIEAVLFIFTVVLAMTDSTEWRAAFFWCTIVTVVLINMANGIYQNTVFGMAAKLPSKYTGAVILGSNISGTFASIINLAARITAPSPRTAAIYYFITALFVLLVCFDTYFALPLNRFYRYHELQSEKAQQKKVQESARRGSPRTPWGLIFRKCALQLFNVFFVFFITLSLFPNVLSQVKRVDPSFFVPDSYFTDVTCFLTFNVFAMLGSLLATFVTWPSPKWLVLPVTLRVVFIPFFMACNYLPAKRDHVTILITEDYVYWTGVIVMAFTSGYLSAIAMEYVPRCVEPQYAPIAGMLGAAFLITGIFIGIVFSMILPFIAEVITW